jgi:hypothetical protein
MNDWEIHDELQKERMRFDAALKFATTSMLFGSIESGTYRQPTFDEAIQMADHLIEKLGETRTKTDEDPNY